MKRREREKSERLEGKDAYKLDKERWKDKKYIV